MSCPLSPIIADLVLQETKATELLPVRLLFYNRYVDIFLAAQSDLFNRI